MKSLLNKSLSQFMICTGLMLLLTAPLFYLLTKCFYAEDLIDIIEAVQQGNSIPPLDLERDIIIGMMIQFLLIFIILSISLLITMRFITRRLWQPFDDTLQKTEQFNLAQSEIPEFRETQIKEFARLNASLKRLMEIKRVISSKENSPRMPPTNCKPLLPLSAASWTCLCKKT